jgi:GntR family transcriptional regulator / MocR family aminotransferase
MKSADCITGTSVGQLDEVVENAEQTDFWRTTSGGMIKDVVRKAEKAGVGLYAVDPFYIKPPRRTGVVLGYAPLSEREIREGIRRLAEALT